MGNLDRRAPLGRRAVRNLRLAGLVGLTALLALAQRPGAPWAVSGEAGWRAQDLAPQARPAGADLAALERVDDCLRRAERGWRGAPAESLERLCAGGSALEPVLLDRLVSGRGPGAAPGDPDEPLNRFQEDLILTALTELGGELCAERFEALGGWRAATGAGPLAGRLLGLAAARFSGARCAELAAFFERRPPDRAQRQHLRGAIARWAARDASLYPNLAPLFALGVPELEVCLLQALCDAGEVRALERLEALLLAGRHDPQTVLALAGELAPRAGLAERRRWSELAAGWTSSQRAALAAEACRLIGRLSASWAAESLLAPLQGEAAVREAAHAALVSLSGQRFPPQRGLWESFIAEERRFEAQGLPKLLSQIRHAPVERLAGCLRDLAAHPLAKECARPTLEARHDDGEPRVQALLSAYLTRS